ncbi:hypothetical protein PFFVO_05477, partial [Plasmodium falciparum Vietnam Oak-Knoll (FVO)]
KGEYALRGKSSVLNDVCKITLKHSNRNPAQSTGPCNGKDGDNKRFKIGTPWKGGEQVSTSYSDVFLPPRRQHMCTSNLEHLNTKSTGLSESKLASNSLLGDVLLAAKYEAEDIKKNYKERNGQIDNKGKCRAIRYSFADLGDIIRGRDLWDLDEGSKKMEGHLKKIFKQIKEKHPGVQEKYNSDNDYNKYINLRSDWWEANRHKVWKAMKCEISELKDMSGHHASSSHCGYSHGMPVDDYIPQRLRWMTEWAEWYCKSQSQEYDKLMGACGSCMGKGKVQGCTSGDVDSVKKCEKCKTACDEYWNKIKPWKGQWNTMEIKYLTLYAYAQMASNNKGDMSIFGNAVGPKDKPVVQILQELLPPKSVKPGAPTPTLTSPYFTAAGYIHQEARVGECEEQKHFCTSGDKENKDKYAFREKPKDHDDACACENNTKPQPAPKKEEEACNMVNTILSAHAGKNEIDSCNEKNDRTWNCSDDTFNEHNRGACMPPRRQSLCIHDLKVLTNTSSEKQLREAFINCAAIETHFLWIYYKNKNSSIVDTQLQNGNIPDEFKSIMYYTFGDYRDICLGTDISSDSNIKGISQKVNDILNSQYGKTHEQNITPKTWWEKNKNDIWQGILCALPHSDQLKNKAEYKTPPEEFAQTPQFLRWMIEWGEEFCRERKKLEDNVKTECNRTNSSDVCKPESSCKSACKAYEDYVNKKKNEFNKQNNKFVRNANEPNADQEYNDYKLKEGKGPSKQGNHYLLDKCDNKKCSCMEGNVLTDVSSEKPFGIYAFPKVRICNCLGGRHAPSELQPPAQQPQPEAPQEPAVKKEEVKVCDIVSKILTKDALQDACKLKYNGKYYGWKCISGATTATETSSPSPDAASSPPADSGNTATTGGSICIPPRRRKLYLGGFDKFISGEPEGSTSATSQSPNGDLLAAFVESAAVETFFLWHRYKEEKKPQAPQLQLLGVDTLENSGEQNPQSKLQESGEIPDGFLRQMFYTLGDYRDILFSGSNDSKKSGYSDIITGDKEIQEREKTIKGAIQKFFEQTRGSPSPGDKKPVQTTTKPEDWWKTNGEHIWNGMICALTYKETSGSGSDGKTTTITQDTNLKDQLLENGKQPKKNYQYSSVTIGASDTGPKGNDDTKLKDFVKLPPFFRWLHEWGSDFCGKRARMLKDVKTNCLDENGNKHCSGDGLKCNDPVPDKEKIYEDFHCPSCATPCGLYKRWIGRKKIEFTEQYNAYTKQKDKCEKESKSAEGKNHDNGFCETLTMYNDAGDFLNRLKKGPCKNNNEEGSGEDEIKFDKPEVTFKHTDNCKPCSEFKIKCNGGVCTGGVTKGNCNGGTITADAIGKMVNSTDINMLVSDNTMKKFEGDLEACRGAGIFKGIRKDEWTCGNVCGVDICKLEKKDTNGQKSDEHITVKELVKRWLEYFFEDYNRIQKKLKPCIENGKGSTCIKKCVDKWVEEKKQEWKKINATYIQKYTRNNDVTSNDLNSFLETLIPRMNLVNDKGKITKLSKFGNSCGCSASASSTNGNEDAIDCMLKKLKDKIEECEKKHTPSDKECNETLAQTPDETLDDDIETEEAKKMVPTICKIEETKEPVVEEKCEEVKPPAEHEKKEEEKEEEKDKGDEEEEAAGGPAGPSPSTPAAPKKDEK